MRQGSSSMEKILIIEDDMYIRELYEGAFKRAGYEVEIASDGEEALEKAEKQTFDLILLDIMLPKVTGIDVLTSLRGSDSTSKDTPIFLITNLGHDDIIKEAFKIGADGYLLKSSVTPKVIVKEIDSFFAKQKEKKQPS